MINYGSAFTGVQIDAALTKANSATQPGDLGTAATTDAADYATAAQGALADSATQPGDLVGFIWGTDGTDGIFRMNTSMYWSKDAGDAFVTLAVGAVDCGTF